MTSKQSLPWEQGCSGSPTETTALVDLLPARGGRGWLWSLPASPSCSALILSDPQAPGRTGQPLIVSNQHRNLIVQEVTLICPLAELNQSAHSAPGREPAARSPLSAALNIRAKEIPAPNYIRLINQFISVTQSCPTLCNPMNHSTPGLPVHHQLPEFTQTRVH